MEVAIALGCIVLSNTRNQELLQEEPGFNFDVLLDLLKSKSEASCFFFSGQREMELIDSENISVKM